MYVAAIPCFHSAAWLCAILSLHLLSISVSYHCSRRMSGTSLWPSTRSRISASTAQRTRQAHACRPRAYPPPLRRLLPCCMPHVTLCLSLLYRPLDPLPTHSLFLCLFISVCPSSSLPFSLCPSLLLSSFSVLLSSSFHSRTKTHTLSFSLIAHMYMYIY